MELITETINHRVGIGLVGIPYTHIVLYVYDTHRIPTQGNQSAVKIQCQLQLAPQNVHNNYCPRAK